MNRLSLTLFALFISGQLVQGGLDLNDMVKLGSVNRAAALLGGGAAVNTRDISGWTTLHNAAHNGDVAMINLLLAHHANVTAQTEDHGKTALHLAAYAGEEGALRVLLNAGDALESTDINGQTALHLASWHNHPGTVALLLDHGAKVNAKDKGGSTPLHLATIKNSVEVVEKLLIYCPDLRLPDSRGRTAVQVARERNDTTIMGIFQDHVQWPCSRHRLRHLAKRVNITDDGEACPQGEQEYPDKESYSWWLRETAAGETVVIPCPALSNGTGTWTCSQGGTWQRTPILSQCQAATFSGVQEALASGNATAAEIMSQVTVGLQSITLMPGDFLILANILHRIGLRHQKDLEQMSPREALRKTEAHMHWVLKTVQHLTAWPSGWWSLAGYQRTLCSTYLQASVSSAAAAASALQRVPFQNFTGDNADVYMVRQPVDYFRTVDRRSYAHPHFNMTRIALPRNFHRGYVQYLGTVRVVFNSYQNLHCTANTIPCNPAHVKGERDLPAKAQVNSAIIGASVGGNASWHAVLGEVVEVRLEHVYKGGAFRLGDPTCVWWDARFNGWATDGCRLAFTGDDYSVCHCDRLTNLALVVDVLGVIDGADVMDFVMQCVVLVGGVVSAVSLAMCLVSFLAFRDVREKTSTLVHANLCLCLLASELVVLAGLDASRQKLLHMLGGLEAARPAALCAAVSALLLALVLTTFTWNSIEALHTYLSLVKEPEAGSRIGRYYMCVGYLVPMMYVAGTLALTHTVGYSHEQVCWPPSRGLIWTFAAPLAVILLVNVLSLLMTLRVGSGAKDSSKQKVPLGSKFSSSLSLLLLRCLAWVTGFLYFTKGTHVMALIFTLLNSMQGVAILFFHIALNEHIMRGVKRVLK